MLRWRRMGRLRLTRIYEPGARSVARSRNFVDAIRSKDSYSTTLQAVSIVPIATSDLGLAPFISHIATPPSVLRQRMSPLPSPS